MEELIQKNEEFFDQVKKKIADKLDKN